jgi:hypothetical protein
MLLLGWLGGEIAAWSTCRSCFSRIRRPAAQAPTTQATSSQFESVLLYQQPNKKGNNGLQQRSTAATPLASRVYVELGSFLEDK